LRVAEFAFGIADASAACPVELWFVCHGLVPKMPQ
jgi:hypothetical protein